MTASIAPAARPVVENPTALTVAAATQSKMGFTLVELLVVITIIVILLALLAPALDQAIYQAELAVCAARQDGLLTIFHAYAADEGRRKYPSGINQDGGDRTFFVPMDMVRIVEASAGNNRSPRATSLTTWGGTLTTGIVPQMLVDPSYRDFGYRSERLGYVIGYQYLGGRPFVSKANNGTTWPVWQSPISLARSGDGQLVSCWNMWASDDGWSWVAHGRERSPLGIDPPSGGGYHYNGPGAGADVIKLSAGGNIARADGSVQWKMIEDTQVYTTIGDRNGNGSVQRLSRW